MPTLVKPRIERRTPGDLVEAARAGRLRVPGFQRLYRWTSSDVVALFDSMYKGYPIGNLLLWERPAPAQSVRLGPLGIDAPAMDRCHWVVDGQQRVTSIVGALTADETVTDSRFRIFFDLEEERFHSVPVNARPARTRIPLRAVASNKALLSWQRDNADVLTERHFDVADRVTSVIRDYEIPAYVVQSPDERMLREIFARLNTTGRRMTEPEVFQALWSAAGTARPSDLRGLVDAVAGLGFGRLDEQLLLRCLRAIRGSGVGRGPTADVWSEFGGEDEVTSALRDTERALALVVAFLRDVAGIPHARLLPYALVVPVLSRFVHLFGQPDDHTAVLLRRWIWRGALVGVQPQGFTPALRQAVEAVGDNARESALRLLWQLPPPVGRMGSSAYVDIDAVRMNQAAARVNVLGMLSLAPRDLHTGEPVDIQAELDAGESPLRRILHHSPGPEVEGLVNRLLHGPSPVPLLDAILAAPPEWLGGHAVQPAAATALAMGDVERFFHDRFQELSRRIASHADRMAEWGARDDVRLRDLMGIGS